jgi:hypothetical protein
MLALTTRKGRNYFGDCPVADWKAAGLPKESTAKGVIRTIERSQINQRLGSLTDADLQRVRDSLRGLPPFAGPIIMTVQPGLSALYRNPGTPAG